MRFEFRILFVCFMALLSCKPENSTKPNLNHDVSKVNANLDLLSRCNHIEQLRNSRTIDQTDELDHDPMYFIDYIIQNQLEAPEDRKYLKDRRFLRKLHVESCSQNQIIIRDTLQNGEICKIELTAGPFNEENHILEHRETEGEDILYESIDGKFPYGGLYGKISREVKSIKYKRDDRLLEIDESMLPSINEPIFCLDYLLLNGVEAYEDEDFIYVYLTGGNAANFYFCKMVFNDNGFVTSILADYTSLAIHGSFVGYFIGY